MILARGEHMRRRTFIALLGGAAAAWPLAARAQQADRARRVGFLIPYANSDRESQIRVKAFQETLQELGWTAGRDVQTDYRWTADEADLTERFTKELVKLAPDVIVCPHSPRVAARNCHHTDC